MCVCIERPDQRNLDHAVSFPPKRRCPHQETTDIHRAPLQFPYGKPSHAKRLYRIITVGVKLRAVVVHHHVDVILRPDHIRSAQHGALAALCDIIHTRPPVCHNNAVILPFFSQYGGIQVICRRCPEPVYRIVRGHHRPRIALFYRDLKRFQVNFPQRPLGDNRIDNMPSCLL